MAGVVTANEIHLPLGRPLVAELRSADVIHELWVPQIGPKLADVPGQTNRLLIESNSEGTFLGQCAEFCGAGHAWMRVRVIVQPPDQFRQWEQSSEVRRTGPGRHGAGAGNFSCHARAFNVIPLKTPPPTDTPARI